MGIAIVQQASGVNAIMYYAPTMLTSIGMTSNAALIATVGNGLVSVIMTCFGLWLIGKISRRAMIKLGQFGCTGSLIFIVLVSFFLPETVAGQPYAIRSYMVIAGMLMFLSFQQGALSPSTWLLLAEIFPNRFRGLFIGIAVFGMWIANFIISLLFPIALASLGLAGTLIIFVGIGVLSSIFIIKCVPETQNRTLEQIENDLQLQYS